MVPPWLGVLSFSLHFLVALSSPIANTDPVRSTDAPTTPCVYFLLNGQMYNMTYAPNPLFPAYLPTVDSAVREANLIIPSAVASSCSKHIGEFLFYAYLPQCFSFQKTTILVFPCAEFCQRIRSCCGSALLASYGISWPEWLHCGKIEDMVSKYQGVCYSPPSFSDDQNCSLPPTPQTDATSAATSTPAATAATSESVAASSSTPSSVVLSTTTSQPTDPSNSPGCSHFNFSPWSEQYYNTAYFPNPLSPAYLPTAATALLEASRIFPIALSSNCSKHIGEFLLYSYFPQCYFSPPSTHVMVFPCEDFCEMIQSCCSSGLASYGIQWPDWLDCGRIGTATSIRNPGVCFRPLLNETEPKCVTPPTTHSTGPLITLPPATTTLPPATLSPSSPPPPPPPCYCNYTCDSCVIRSAITEATFTVQNFDYDFMAKVTVSSKLVESCNTTYGITIIESYLPCPNSAIPQFPLSGSQITTYTQPCSSCIDLTVGRTYWVGGVYYINCRGQPVWEIPRIKGAAALWTTKYDQKGPTWVQTARREHGC